MAQLRQDFQKIIEHDIEIISIGPEKADKFKTFWEEENLPFTGLPDPKHTVLKRYGQQIKIFQFGRMPAQMLINKAGIVRYVYYGKKMDDIPDYTVILEAID